MKKNLVLFRFKELLLAILLGFPSYSTFQLHYNYILNLPQT